MAEKLEDARPSTEDQDDEPQSEYSDDGFAVILPIWNTNCNNHVKATMAGSVSTTTEIVKVTSNPAATIASRILKDQARESTYQKDLYGVSRQQIRQSTSSSIAAIQTCTSSLKDENSAKDAELEDAVMKIVVLKDEVDAKIVSLEDATRKIERLEEEIKLKDMNLDDAIERAKDAENTVGYDFQTNLCDYLLTHMLTID